MSLPWVAYWILLVLQAVTVAALLERPFLAAVRWVRARTRRRAHRRQVARRQAERAEREQRRRLAQHERSIARLFPRDRT